MTVDLLPGRSDQVLTNTAGSARTYVDKLTPSANINGRAEATHRFLQMKQPQSHLALPASRIFKAGETYQLPFNFVVPSQLLPRACNHKCDNDLVKEAHLHLPPSLGDAETSGYGGQLMDDLAPEMSKVSYAIRVRLLKDRVDGTDAVLAETAKKLSIQPSFEEQPPMNVDGDDQYCLRQEKTIRKGFMKGKLGRLVMEASQPKSFRLPALSPGDSRPPVTTMAKVHLRFDPHDEQSLPPRLGSLASKLKVTTFFASTPRHSFPKKHSSFPDMSQGFITLPLPLSTLCVASVDWTRHADENEMRATALRRDSAVSGNSVMSTSSTVTASSAYRKSRPFYTATILVPLSLPTSKNLVPTFHSCIVSRIYSLTFSLSISGQPLTTSWTLKVPVEIIADGSVHVVERRRQSEQAELAFVEANAMFQPRLIGVGNSSLPGTDDLPPGYDAHVFNNQAGGGYPGERAIADVAVSA